MATLCDVPNCIARFSKRLTIVSLGGYHSIVSENSKANLCTDHIRAFECISNRQLKAAVRDMLECIALEREV